MKQVTTMSLTELLVTLLVALIVFGPKQLPMLAKHLGLLFGKANRLKSRAADLIDIELKQQQLTENIKKAMEAEKSK